jgi:type IV fimbrial biogenesis protein FimT
MKSALTQSPTPRRQGRRGFTAVEMLVVLLLVAVLASIAAPSMLALTHDMQQKSASNLLASDLNFARLEAIKRNARVLLCARSASDAGASNDTGCASAAPSWASGWLVCLDTSNDGVDNCDAATAANPNPMLVRTALAAPFTLAANNGAVVYVVRFNANSTQGAVGAPSVTLTLGGTWSSAAAKTVTVAAAGSIQSN